MSGHVGSYVTGSAVKAATGSPGELIDICSIGELVVSWYPFDDGRTIGEAGSESGRVVCDEEHAGGARITLEQGGMTAPWSITCGVYGWMVHTRFFSRREQAELEFDPMKTAIDGILAAASRIAGEDDDTGYRRVAALCGEFVDRFPTGES